MTRSIAIVMCASALGLTACKHSNNEKPDEVITDKADDTNSATSDASKPPTTDTPPPAALSDQQRAILLAAGCQDDDALTATTCNVCAEDAAEQKGPTDITTLDGEFSDVARNAVIMFRACEPQDGEAVTRIVRVESSDEVTWTANGSTSLPGEVTCVAAPTSLTRSNLVCKFVTQRYGTTSTYYDHVDFGAVASGEALRSNLLELSRRDSCELNLGIEHVVVGPTFPDTDGDKSPEIVLEVSTTTGPFTKPLEECPEGNFTGSLEPPRESKTTTTTYTYKQTPEGPVEQSGKSSYHSLGKEVEDLLEP